MVKLPNIFPGNTIGLTQSPHGQYQSYKGIDVVASDMITPFDGCKTSQIYGTGEGRYFNLYLPDGSFIQCVHGIPTIENHVFKKGEICGKNIPYSKGNHWHVAINVKGVWFCILDYIDRTNTIKLAIPFASPHWQYWSTWQDLYLNINQETMEDKYMPSLAYENKEVQDAIKLNNSDRDPLYSDTSAENMQRMVDNKMFLVMYYRMLDNIERYVDSHLTHNDITKVLDPEKLVDAIMPYIKEGLKEELGDTDINIDELVQKVSQKVLMKLDPKDVVKKGLKELTK